MKYFRYIISVLLASLAFAACKKNYVPISDHPFDISLPKLEANRVVIDIIPDNNDFYYSVGSVRAEAFDRLGQEAFVKLVDKTIKTDYKQLFKTESLEKFPEWLFRGAYDEVNHNLDPNTEYIVFAFPYDGINPVVDKFTKIEFTTPEIVKSDNTFELSIDGSVISITPSNGDGYFYDYCTFGELNDYQGSIDRFFRKTIDIYWEYGFLDTFIFKGAVNRDIKKYYPNVADGDKFYLGISGYDKGITTSISLYGVTVHLDGTAKSTIELIPDFLHETKSSLPVMMIL